MAAGGASLVREVSSQADLDALCASHGGLTAVLLWAPWHPPSVHLAKVVEAVAAQQRNAKFGKVNTEVCPEIAAAVGADQVPYVVFLDPKGNKLESLAGANAPKLVEKVKSLAARPMVVTSTAGSGAATAPAASGADDDLNTRLRNLVNFSPVMLFMKGNKFEPFCGFSRKAVDMLNKHDAEYSTFDILQDDDVRQGLKEYSNWKTYPQLYINGELLGGLDIMQEMDEDGSLLGSLPKGEAAAGAAVDTAGPSLNDRLKVLVNQDEVMLFIKGTKEQPFCGFSKKAVAMLNKLEVKYTTFDILGDEEVRHGLKEYANWKTYPQMYVKGELIGGLDIMQEMEEDGSLLDAVPGSAK